MGITTKYVAKHDYSKMKWDENAPWSQTATNLVIIAASLSMKDVKMKAVSNTSSDTSNSRRNRGLNKKWGEKKAGPIIVSRTQTAGRGGGGRRPEAGSTRLGAQTHAQHWESARLYYREMTHLRGGSTQNKSNYKIIAYVCAFFSELEKICLRLKFWIWKSLLKLPASATP